jgi:hypothetical protein
VFVAIGVDSMGLASASRVFLDIIFGEITVFGWSCPFSDDALYPRLRL